MKRTAVIEESVFTYSDAGQATSVTNVCIDGIEIPHCVGVQVESDIEMRPAKLITIQVEVDSVSWITTEDSKIYRSTSVSGKEE